MPFACIFLSNSALASTWAVCVNWGRLSGLSQKDLIWIPKVSLSLGHPLRFVAFFSHNLGTSAFWTKDVVLCASLQWTFWWQRFARIANNDEKLRDPEHTRNVIKCWEAANDRKLTHEETVDIMVVDNHEIMQCKSSSDEEANESIDEDNQLEPLLFADIWTIYFASNIDPQILLSKPPFATACSQNTCKLPLASILVNS